MTHHAYVDESGTMDFQGVMTVAMVVLEGSHSAKRLHEHIMTALNPQYPQLVKQLKKERKSTSELPQLHFADMTGAQKRDISDRLAKAKVTVFAASHWHEGAKTHDERFQIYTELVKMCIRSGFNYHKELAIAIAKQGGWPKYQQDFLARLRTLPGEFTGAGNFRKADLELQSAVKPGIQLADFYVGAVRDFLMDESLFPDFYLIQQQILSRDVYNPLKVIE
jgi:hypothetical protein